MCMQHTPSIYTTFDSFGSLSRPFTIAECLCGSTIVGHSQNGGAWHELIGEQTCLDAGMAMWLAIHRISFREAMKMHLIVQ